MDIESFVNSHTGVIVICRANMNSYLPSVLSCFAYFNDVESVQKEDFLPDASAPEIEDDDELYTEQSYDDTSSQYVPGSNSGDAIQSLQQVDVTARPKKRKK